MKRTNEPITARGIIGTVAIFVLAYAAIFFVAAL